MVQWFQNRRSRILASISLSTDKSSDGNERLRLADDAAGRGALARMSGEQAAELKMLERDYEEVLDENCRVFAGYLKEVLENSEGNTSVAPPELVLGRNWDHREVWAVDGMKIGDLKLGEKGIEENGRYNVGFLFSFSALIFAAFLHILFWYCAILYCFEC